MKLLIRLRQALCRHRFDPADLKPRPSPDGNVKWRCWRCGREYEAHCGLQVLSHGGGRVEEKATFNREVERRMRQRMELMLDWVITGCLRVTFAQILCESRP